MSETSYLWSQGSDGDQVSEYSDLKYWDHFKTGEIVIPGYLNDLEITGGKTATDYRRVYVASGAARVFGVLYENDEEVAYDIVTTGVFPRYDGIFLALDLNVITGGDCRLYYATGSGVNYPTPSTAGVIYVPLAYIYLASNSATLLLDQHDITDRRRFLSNGFYPASMDNCVRNSEYLAWSDPTTVPDMWREHATPTAVAIDTTAANIYHRERAVQTTGGGMTQRVYLPITSYKSGGETKKVVVRGSVVLGTAGDVAYVNTAWTGGDWEGRYKSSTPVTEFIIRIDVPSETAYIDLDLNATGGTVEWGQIWVCLGYETPDPRAIHERIMFDNLASDTPGGGDPDFDGAAYDDAYSLNVDLSNHWNGSIPVCARALICACKVNDSGSAAGTCHATFSHPDATNFIVRVECSGTPNDDLVWGTITIPINQLSSTAFVLSIAASGAGTLDMALVPVGIIT